MEEYSIFWNLNQISNAISCMQFKIMWQAKKRSNDYQERKENRNKSKEDLGMEVLHKGITITGLYVQENRGKHRKL